MYTVITHNGKAHIDEVMGIALLVYKLGCLPHEIIRIHPDEAVEWIKRGQLGPKTYYIDCGLDFSPEKNIFDHHHSKDLESSAFLVFNHFFKDLSQSTLAEYISILSKVDTQGPKSLNDYSRDSETYIYFSFIQKLLVKQFEKSPMEVIEIISNGLNDILIFEKEKVTAKKWLELKGNIEIREIEGIRVLEYLKEPPAELSKAVKSADGEIIDSEKIDVVYSYDSDNQGIRTLFRTLVGHNRVDFTLATIDDVKFLHPGGFLLKFRPSRSSEWLDILTHSKLS